MDAAEIELERAATAGEFQVTAQLNFEGDRTVESDGVLTAAIERIDRCRARGVLPIAAGGREVVDRFLAAARRDDDERALVRGVDADGYRLMCRSWRGRVPARITIVAASGVSGVTETIRPRSSAPERSGAKRSRKSAGTSGVVAASAIRWRRCLRGRPLSGATESAVTLTLPSLPKIGAEDLTREQQPTGDNCH